MIISFLTECVRDREREEIKKGQRIRAGPPRRFDEEIMRKSYL